MPRVLTSRRPHRRLLRRWGWRKKEAHQAERVRLRNLIARLKKGEVDPDDLPLLDIEVPVYTDWDID